MTAQELHIAIKIYLGYNPGEKVKKHAPGHDPAYITEWNLPEKQPTLKQLEQIYNNNINTYNLEKENEKKQKELFAAVKEKIAKQYIIDNNITSIEDLE